MITILRSQERGHRRSGGHERWMTFDPELPDAPWRTGFRALKSLNEEGLSPGAGFQMQVDKDLEVLTYVQEGSLIEENASGRSNVIVGECRQSTARSGTLHRASNGSLTQHSHAYLCCILSDRKEFKSHAEQKRFPVAERRGISRLVASPDGTNASLQVHQDVRVYSAVLDPGHHLVHELAPGRGAWLHVVKGRIQAIHHGLRAGDGASFVDEPAVSLTAQEASEILLFDLA